MKNNFTRLISPLRFAALGALTCVVATFVAEFFLQLSTLPIDPGKQNAPLAIALLIDKSGSMEGEPIVEVRDAAIDFIGTLERRHTYLALIPFSDSATLLSPVLAPEQDPAILIQQIRTLYAGGGTGMVEALVLAQEAFKGIESPNNAVLLFTDGLPNDPIPTLLQAEVLRREGTVMVAVGTADSDIGFLKVLTLNETDQLFTTQLGEYAIAFEEAGQAIVASAFGTVSTSQGLIVVTIIALFLSAALLVSENVWSLRGHWWRDLWWMPPLGAALGFLGATVGENLTKFDVASWAFVGMTSGVSLGLVDLAKSDTRSWQTLVPRKSVRGAFFGLVGGTVGGILFGLVFGNSDLQTTQGELTALVSRLSGFALLGFFIGLALKAGEELLKDVWLIGVTKGPYEGKQFILNKPKVRVGQSGNNDINLARELGLGNAIGLFTQYQGQWFCDAIAGDADESEIKVNGAGVTDQTPLSDNSIISFGGTDFLFRRRGEQGQIALTENWALVGDEVTYNLPRQKQVRIGNSTSCDVVLADPSVLSHHCTLEFSDQGVKLKGIAGAYIEINDQPLMNDSSAILQQGDLVSLGDVELGLISR